MSYAISTVSRPAFSLGLNIMAMIRIARERRALAALDSEQLRDLGLHHDAVAREVARPFWDLPARFK